MRILKGFALLLAFLMLCGMTGRGGSGSSGGGTAITSCTGDLASCTQTGAVLAATVTNGSNLGAGTVPNAALVTAPLTAVSTLDTTKLSSAAMPSGVTGSPTLAQTNFTGSLAATKGGTGNALQYVVNDRGTTTTPACDFSLGYICRFATTANATMTASNIPGTTTAPVMVQVVAYSSAGNSTLTFPSSFKGYVSAANFNSSPVLNIYQGAGGIALNYTTVAFCDGTSCTVQSATGDGEFITFRANTVLAQASTTIGSADNAVASMARIPLNFSVDQQTALVANEHMGTYLTPKAITIENATVDETNATCATAAVVTCFDCGTSVGACTSGQTSTIWTSPNITTALSGTSVAGGSITTANVAAAHYITCEVTAGTCATLQAVVSLMARPQ